MSLKNYEEEKMQIVPQSEPPTAEECLSDMSEQMKLLAYMKKAQAEEARDSKEVAILLTSVENLFLIQQSFFRSMLTKFDELNKNQLKLLSVQGEYEKSVRDSTAKTVTSIYYQFEAEQEKAFKEIRHFLENDTEEMIKKVNNAAKGAKKAADNAANSFVFTVLRDDNTLFLVRGSNPITLLHFPEYGLYIYASTADILKTAMKSARFSAECENVKIDTGDIVRIDCDGRISAITFEEIEHHYSFNSYRLMDWYEWYGLEKTDEEYENDLLMICGCYGVDKEDVELLFEFGYSCDEIEEMLMDHDLLEQAMAEIKTLYLH